MASNIKGENNGLSNLTPLEILILGCTKSKPKSETKISKEVKINLPIVSQVITDLMLKGFMERTRKRRMISDKEYFSTSLEGLIALERAHSNNTNYTFSQVFVGLKDNSQRILEELTFDSIALKSILGIVRVIWCMAKFVLTK